MNELFLMFAAAFILPLLFQSWRIALIGLGVQGILLSFLPAAHVHEWSPQVLFECVTLFVMRGVVTPILISRRLSPELKQAELNLIGTNLFQWASAAVLLAIGYLLGHAMAPERASEAAQLGTAGSSILIGMLILSNQNNRLGQSIGILTIESGMALVELLSPHAMPFPVSIGVTLVYGFLVLTIVSYLRTNPSKFLGPNLADK